jgi:hypothetical protein
MALQPNKPRPEGFKAPHQKPPPATADAPAWTPEPALDPHAQKPPRGHYADGMSSAEEQRLRSAWIESHGMKAYHDAVDRRSEDEKTMKQVPGVTPPTKRE